MNQLFRMLAIQLVWYIGAAIAGGTVVFFWLKTPVSGITETYLLILFSIFLSALFAALSYFVLRRWRVHGFMWPSLFLAHGTLLFVGYGVIPLSLHDNATADQEGFFLLSPTGIISLVVAAITALVLYRFFLFFITIVLKRAFVLRPSAIIIGGIVLLSAGLAAFIVNDLLFIFALVLMPFMRFVFLIIDSPFALFGSMLLIISVVYHIQMLRISISCLRNENQALLQQVLACSKLFFFTNLVLWVLYMKALGIAWQIGSWSPFPFFP